MRISDWSSDVCSSDLLSENSLRRMTLPEFREVAGDVHAMIEFSRRVRNSIVGLQSSGIAYTIPQKLDALTAHIWNSKAENGSSVTVVIAHILYGGPDDLDRKSTRLNSSH